MIAAMILMGGCAGMPQPSVEAPPPDTEPDTQTAFVSMESEPVLSYEVPKSSPHILVDELGYEPGQEKKAYFFGGELPERFFITELSTGKNVYEGKLESVRYSDLYQCNIAVGEFHDLTKEGTYRISADLLGNSCDFAIGTDLYRELFREACRTYYYNRCGMTLTSELAGANAHNACHTGKAVLRRDMTAELDVTGGWHQDGSGSKDSAAAAKSLINILLSYEVFPGAFTDDTGIPESGNGIPDILDEARYETEWLLKMQDPSTGGVYSAVTVAENPDRKSTVSYVEDPGEDASYAFAAALSKFSFFYQDFDREFATLCLKAADRAWKYGVLNAGSASFENAPASEWKFPAAAEIYRASASKECESFLNGYLAEDPFKSEPPDGLPFYGCVTYLNTKQKVNTKYCGELMRSMMLRAEKISEGSRNAPFGVPATPEQNNNAELLNNMMTMTLVDHIITNHEYDTIIEDYLHYFLGRNPMSVVYVDHVGTFSYMDLNESLGLMKQFDSDAKLIFMLSRILSKDGFAG